MLANIILAGLIPGMMAKPIIRRDAATAAAEAPNYRASYVVQPPPSLSSSIFTTHTADPASYTSAYSVAPVSSPTTTSKHSALASFPVELPHTSTSVTPSVSADPTHSIQTPPVRPPMAPSPEEHPYAIHSPPAYSSAVAPVIASDPAKHPYSTSTPPAHSSAVSPVHASDPAVHQYAVATPPAHASAVSPVMAAHPAEDPYSVSAPPAHSHPVPAPSHHADPTYGIAAAAQTGASSARPAMNDHSLASGSASPAFHHAKGSENEECAERCEVKCQTADIAFEITQCRTSCLAACTTTEKTEKTGVYGSPGLMFANAAVAAAVAPEGSCANSDGARGSNLKSAVPAGHGHSAPVVGAESNSFDACMRSCKGKMQHADIAGDVSQGKQHCEEACAHLAEAKVTIPVKRDSSVDAPFRPPPPEVEVGSGIVTYESCMRSCGGKWQTAFHISQGEHYCKESCARYAKAGTNLVVKREKSVDAPFRAPEPEVEVGTGFASYEACMKSCGGRWQTAFGISQGDHHCKTSCARYAKAGPEVIARKDKPVDGPFRAPEPEVEIGPGFETFEGCMKSCGGKWQNAFGISQGKNHCQTACARYAKVGPEVIVKKEALPLPAHEEGPFTPPSKPVVDSGFTAFEACMDGCRGEYQIAPGGVSQGKYDCNTKCARYASFGTSILGRRQVA